MNKWLGIGLMIVMAISGCQGVHEQRIYNEDQVMLRMAADLEQEHPGYQLALALKDQVAAATQGQVLIKLYDEDELMTKGSIIQQVAFGGIDMAWTKGVYLTAYSKTFHSLMTSGQDDVFLIDQLNNGDKNARIIDEFRGEKINVIHWYLGSKRGICEKDNQLEGLVGKKVGAFEDSIYVDELATTGYIFVPVQEAEMKTYLELDYVQGMASDFLQYMESGSYEIAPFFHPMIPLRYPNALVLSNEAMKGLTVAQQAIIRDIAKGLVTDYTEGLRRLEERYSKSLEAFYE